MFDLPPEAREAYARFEEARRAVQALVDVEREVARKAAREAARKAEKERERRGVALRRLFRARKRFRIIAQFHGERPSAVEASTGAATVTPSL